MAQTSKILNDLEPVLHSLQNLTGQSLRIGKIEPCGSKSPSYYNPGAPWTRNHCVAEQSYLYHLFWIVNMKIN